MRDKIKSIKKLSDDYEYLKDEYDRIKLWGSRPDGDVKFDNLMEWLAKNAHEVRHMIDVAEKIQEL